MAAPYVTGIVRRNVSRTEIVLNLYPYINYYDKVIGSKQKKPVDLPLPYSRRTGSSSWTGNYSASRLQNAETMISDSQTTYATSLALARNKAYEKLKNEILSSSQLGASLAEYDQATAMIVARGKQLFNTAHALKRLDFKAAASFLSVRLPPKQNFRNAKSFGNLWLEFHFGWEPMVKDIYEGLEVMTRPVKTLWAKSSASESYSRTYSAMINGSELMTYKDAGSARSVMQTGIVVNNPNIVLANQLGLLNPVSIAWELVPFSFVADWFSNVGAVLNSMSDFLGLTLVNPYHTDVILNKFERLTTIPSDPGYFGLSKGKTVYMDRNSGLIYPVLTVKPLKTPSVVRAATQISLLSLFLGKQR